MDKIHTVVHVLDDDVEARSSLVFLLETAGFDVAPHVSAKQFLELAPSITNGCLVTDVCMSDINGVDLMRRLHDLSVRLPTIVVTGYADIPLAVAAMKCGAIDFIEKPFSSKRIVEAVQRAVDLAAART